MTFLRLSLLWATAFSFVAGCSIAVRKAKDFAVSKTDEIAGEAALKKLDEVNPQLAAAIRSHVEKLKSEPPAEGEEKSATPYLDAFKSHWGEAAVAILLALIGKLGLDRRKLFGANSDLKSTNEDLRDLAGLMSKAIGKLTPEVKTEVVNKLDHEAKAAGLSGSIRTNLENLGVAVARS